MGLSEPFFEVAAQLIPVLFLAMVVEERLQPDEQETSTERVMRSWIVALLVIGEFISLAVVAGGINASKQSGSIVCSAMVLAAILIVGQVIGNEMQANRSRRERIGHTSAALTVIGAAVWTMVAMLLS